MGRLRRLTLGALAVLLLGSAPLHGAPVEPIRVLLLGGLNTHEAQAAQGPGQSTLLVKRILEDAGRFAVDVIDDPSTLRSDSLASYAVVVDNWSNYPAPDCPWGEEAQRALLAFVRAGGGFVAIHASTACFPTWTPYRDLIGIYWEEGKANHARVHRFSVKPSTPDHPVTRGLPEFAITDELYQRLTLGPRARVLCTAYSAPEAGGTGEVEPMAVATHYGRGRGFSIVLGHDGVAMDSDGWRLLFARGVEWAATGQVTVVDSHDADIALRPVLRHRSTDGRDALVVVERLVRRASDDPDRGALVAAKLAAAIEADATLDARRFLFDQLSLIATAAEVPTVSRWLGDEELGSRAIQVLQRLDDPAAGTALRAAALRLRGGPLAGVLAALGAKQDRGAVSLLTRHVASADRAVFLAAAGALGRVGGVEALEALRAARVDAPADRAGPIAEALIEAIGSLGPGDPRTLAECRSLWASAMPMPVRRAAFGLLVRGTMDAAVVLEGLRSGDAATAAIASGALAAPGHRDLARGVAAELGGLDAAAQALALLGLARQPDPSLAAAIEPLLGSADSAVREAAAAWMGEAGGAAEVPGLLAALGTTDGATTALARVLMRLPEGMLPLDVREIDAADESAREPLLAAVVQSGSARALELLRAALRSGSSGTRTAALMALAAWPDARPAEELLAYARSVTDAGERDLALRALGATGGLDDGSTVGLVVEGLALEPGTEARRALLRGLELAAGTAGLDAALASLDDDDVREDAARVASSIARRLPAAEAAAAVAAFRRILDSARSGPARTAARDELLRLGVELPITRSVTLAEPGPNLAAGAKASSPDGIESDGQASGDAAAIDGDPGTYWDEADNQSEYLLRVTFPAEVEVGALRITGFEHHQYAPRDFAILCDGRVVVEVTEAVYEANQFAIRFPATRCRTLTLRFVGYYGQSPAVRELEVFGPEAR